jgi:acetyltransferase-like isoleucine patch superfamily enzyme
VTADNPGPAGPTTRRDRAFRGRWLNAAIHGLWTWVSTHGAVGPGDALAERFGEFGDGSCLAFPPGAIFGEQWIRIGRDTLVGPYVSISAGMVPGQHMVTDPVVRIGDRCMIGRGSHIVGHFDVEIGDDVHTGPYVYITDQNHGYENPDEVVHSQWPTDVPVHIGTGSWLGTGVVVLPGTELGRNVVVGAGAVVRGVFPDHSVIAGVPARIVRRYIPGSGWVSGPPPTGSESGPGGVGAADPSDADDGRRPVSPPPPEPPAPHGDPDPSDGALSTSPGRPSP